MVKIAPILAKATLFLSAAGAAIVTKWLIDRDRREARLTQQRGSDEREHHIAQIAKIVQRWHNGEITVDEKRQLIAEENAFYYGREKRSAITGSSLTSVPASGTNGHEHDAPSHRTVQTPTFSDDPWGEEKEAWWKK